MEHLKIYKVTWNTNGRDPPANLDLSKLLGLDKKNDGNNLPDIYSVGFQEINARFDRYFADALLAGEDAWTSAVRLTLFRHGYIKLRTIRMLGIVLSVFCRKDHLIHVKNLETQYTRLSLGGFVGLKGGVSVRLNIFGVSICFVNSHLSAHDHLLQRRVEEYNSLIEYHTFKQEVTTHILYHDYIIWGGDLNFRLEENAFNHEEIVAAIKANELSRLVGRDQLTQVRRNGEAFHELTEQVPTFPPTYKFVVGTKDYDKKRRPAWCDRILYRVNKANYENVDLDIQQHDYRSHDDALYRSSDHQPVSRDHSFSILVFGRDLARQRRIDDFAGLVRFRFPGGGGDEGDSENEAEVEVRPSWFVGEDAIVTYTLDPGAGLYLDTWDWIGLYKENFSSLEDYVTFCWASSCRRTGIPKTSVMPDSYLWPPGRYVLIYMSAKQSVLGISEPFVVGQRVIPVIEAAEEVHED